jgi:hypothetical protein
MEDQLTPREEELINRTLAEMEFYDKYKGFMGNVKATFLQNGPEAAKQYIRSQTDELLTIACDEMFYALFTKL